MEPRLADICLGELSKRHNEAIIKMCQLSSKQLTSLSRKAVLQAPLFTLESHLKAVKIHQLQMLVFK